MFCSNYLWVGPIPSTDRYIDPLPNWCRSIRECFPCTGTRTEHLFLYSVARSIRAVVRRPETRRPEMAVPTGRVFRIQAMTMNKYKQLALTTTSIIRTRPGFD